MTQILHASVAARPFARLATALALMTAGALVVLAEVPIRSLEAVLGARLGDLITPAAGEVDIAGTAFVLRAGTPEAMTYNVEGVCTITPFLCAALFTASAILLVAPEQNASRTALRVGVVGLVLLAANTVRIAGIVLAVGLLGHDDGYWLGHRLVGTLLMLAAVCAALWLLLRPVLRELR